MRCWVFLVVASACQKEKAPPPSVLADPTPAAPSASVEVIAVSANVVGKPAPVDDVAAWVRARGGSASTVLMSSSCYATHIGAVDALMCYGPPSEMLTGGESVFPLRVVTVAGGHTVTALTTPIAAGPLDPEGDFTQPGYDPHYITLDATFDSAGTLTLGDKPGKGCDKVLAQYAGLAPHVQVIKKACAARGTYTLQGDKLVKN